MLSTRVFAISTLLVALLCVFLAVTATPVPAGRGLVLKRQEDNQTELQSDSIPVSSDGDDIKPYNPEDEVPQNVTEKGNSAEGDNKGLRKRW